jgi:VCBS repeat-containing protein
VWQSDIAISERLPMATTPISAQARGIVVILQGKAWVVDANGNRRPLKVGDEVQEGQQIVTEDGARLELALPNGQPLSIASGRELLIDATLLGSAPVDKSDAALLNLNGGSAEVAKIIAAGGDLSAELESTAAGFTGGDGSDAHSFVRLLRIQEALAPLSIDRADQPAATSVDLTLATTQSTSPSDPTLPETTPEPAPVPVPTPTPTPAPVPTPVPPPPAPPVAVKSVPVAVADSATISEDAAPNSISGSVVANDTVGTDTNAAPVTPANVTLTYGTLVLNSDGTYTYTLNNALPAVNALKDGQTLTETFTYTLTDGDGDTSTATLTITVNGRTDGPPSIVPVDGNGSAVGQATVNELGLLTVGNTSETTTGTITVTAPDGLASVVVGGTTVTAAQLGTLGTAAVVIDTGEGNLTLTGYNPVTGALSYSYTLKAAQSQPGVSESADSIALTVNDLGGGTSTGTLVVRILDTTPTAVDDANAVTEDTALVATGSVLTGTVADTVGADANATPVTAATLALTYGSLVLNSNGTYTYTLDNTLPAVNALKTGSTPLTDTYTYTLTDGDGDTTTAVLTITINGHTDGPPSIVPVDGNGGATGQATVNELGLLTVGNTTEATTGTITVSAPDGLASVVVGGTTVTAAQLGNLGTTPITIDTGEGTMVLTGFNAGTGALSYSYTLKDALNQPGATESTDTIALTVNDLGGISSTGNLVVQIIDSTPTAVADAKTIAENTASVNGNVLTDAGGVDTVGADANATPVTAASPTLTYGTLVLNSDGTYTYTLNNALPDS